MSEGRRERSTFENHETNRETQAPFCSKVRLSVCPAGPLLATRRAGGSAGARARAARDYYKALGVTKAATEGEIKRAYRRLARQLHPDVTGDDPKSTERFKEITEAYEVLSDSKRRRMYDLFGAPGPQGTTAEPPPFSTVAEVFADVFRRAQRRTGPEPGVDAEHPLKITLSEAATGCEKVVDVELWRTCAQCEGKGY